MEDLGAVVGVSGQPDQDGYGSHGEQPTGAGGGVVDAAGDARTPGNPANRKRTVSLTAKQFRYSFGNAVSAEESDALHELWTIPGPGRPLFEDASANFTKASPAAVDTHHAVRGPLLLISGTEDHTVALKVSEAVFELYADNPSTTDFHRIDGRGHSLTLDAGCRDVAEVALDWIGRNTSATG